MASRTKRATLTDVALHAGVSASTVSNVVRGTTRVAPKTRARVEEAIAELGYGPDAIARSLRRRATNTIGLVVPNVTNPFFGLLVLGAERAAHARGYAVVMVHTEYQAEMEEEGVRALVGRRVDGALLAGVRADANSYEQLLELGVPVVLAGFSLDDPRIGFVAVDDVQAMTLVLDHLQELGHRRIAFHGDDPAQVMGQRRAKVLAELAAPRGVEVVGREDGPTAIAFQNDSLAIEYLDMLERSGTRVPDDVSLVGFDDVPLAGHVRIGLTSVRNDVHEIGRRATEMLLDAAEDGTAVSRHVLLPAELVVRGSTGPRPGA